MGMISEIGRRSFKVRALLWGIGLLLLLGATTMLYPFMLMIGGSSKTGVDLAENRAVPSFLIDDDAYYRKAMEGFFNEQETHLHQSYLVTRGIFANLKRPAPGNPELLRLWSEFLDQAHYPASCYTPAFLSVQASKQSQPLLLRQFKKSLQQKYGTVENMNRELGTAFKDWGKFSVQTPVFDARTQVPKRNPLRRELEAFYETQPHELRNYTLPEGFYKKSFLQVQYTDSIQAYNQKHQTRYTSWDQVTLPTAYPAGPEFTDAERADWQDFVREILNVIWVRVAPSEKPAFQKYLAARHEKIANLNRLYGTAYPDFSAIPLPDPAVATGPALSDYAGFIQGWTEPDTGAVHRAAITQLTVTGPEYEFRAFLRRKFGTLPELNRSLGTDYRAWSQIWPPQRELHARHVMAHSLHYKWEFVTRNFIAVWEYVFFQGRALFNTVLYCALAVLCSLIVNPLAAYALSRFRPPSTYKMLLFLMVTMAFPPMVTQIPSFLMLREFGLLNSYAALILPGLANGYSIFLLKGFFDSLPRELYESAMIDGAGEIRIFLQFTMSLSKPILAVVALAAFTGAYGNFMMALLICQDQQMWTLMPWLYQLQMSSGQGIIFASLLVAAIPTFLIFVFCQQVIMRGIVVPVEK